MTKKKSLKEIFNSFCFFIGYFIDKIIVNIILICLYPIIFFSCYTIGYFSLKDRKFKSWIKDDLFPINYFLDPTPTILHYFLIGILIGIFYLLIFYPFVMLAIIFSFIIFVLGFYSF